MNHVMKLEFCPVRSDAALTLEMTGEVLVVNGWPVDLAAATAEQPLARDALGCDWILSDVTRERGTLCLMLALPHGAGEVCDDPADLVRMLDADGPVTLPRLAPPPTGPIGADDIAPQS